MLAILRPAGEVHRYDRRLDWYGRVFLEDDPRAQRAHRRVGDATVLVLRQAGGAEQERNRDAVLQADPGVAPGSDIGPVGALAHQRMAAHDDALDRVRRWHMTG